MGILKAIKAPITPPITKKIITYANEAERLPTDKNVTTIAITIPAIPK
jgi:hypothetical protein